MNWAKQHEGTGGKLVIDWSSLHGRFTEDAKDGLERIKQGGDIPAAAQTDGGSDAANALEKQSV